MLNKLYRWSAGHVLMSGGGRLRSEKCNWAGQCNMSPDIEAVESTSVQAWQALATDVVLCRVPLLAVLCAGGGARAGRGPGMWRRHEAAN
jgi:hypothetical protein